MQELQRQDFVLIELAKKAMRAGYDERGSTMGAALRCGSGNVYTGVNIPGRNSVCAEVVALGTAKASGEKIFDSVVVVGGKNMDRIHTPCGNCRELLLVNCPDVRVIVHIGQSGAKKLSVRELLPYSSELED